MGLFDVKPDHTVIIDNKYGFYASEPNPDQAYRKWNWETVEIDKGPPKSFETNETLRKFIFKATVIEDITRVRQELEPITNGLHDFTSIYIGAFKARIDVKISYEESTPGVTFVEFEINEVI